MDKVIEYADECLRLKNDLAAVTAERDAAHRLLDAQQARWEADLDKARREMDRAPDASMQKLQREHDAALKDAERYRWLSRGDNDTYVMQFSIHSNAGSDDAWLPRGKELDAAIDAAMKEQNDAR
jgi:hypothetical protein